MKETFYFWTRKPPTMSNSAAAAYVEAEAARLRGEKPTPHPEQHFGNFAWGLSAEWLQPVSLEEAQLILGCYCNSFSTAQLTRALQVLFFETTSGDYRP